MGKRHRTRQTSARSRNHRGALRPRPWIAGALPRLHTDLVRAYGELALEWSVYLNVFEHHLNRLADQIEELEDAAKGEGDAEFDAATKALDDYADLFCLLRDNLQHSVAAVEMLNGVTPAWVPEAANDALASIDIDAGDTQGLAHLRPAGMLVFDKSPVRMREVLPDGHAMPEVDIDGLMWWTKPPSRDMPSRLKVAPFTRSRALAPLRGEAWKSSTLTEVTCFHVGVGYDSNIDANLWPCVDLLARIGVALQRNDLRITEGQVTFLGAA